MMPNHGPGSGCCPCALCCPALPCLMVICATHTVKYCTSRSMEYARKGVKASMRPSVISFMPAPSLIFCGGGPPDEPLTFFFGWMPGKGRGVMASGPPAAAH